MLRAIYYVRVSTDQQDRDGTSLDSQAAACNEYLERMGYCSAGAFRDAASGASLERPGLEQVRAAVRGGQVDVLVSYSLDRLSRSQNHVGLLDDECERYGVRLEFVTEKFDETPVGRFIRAARAFTDEIEREKIRERTMRGKAQRAREGKLVQGTGKGIFGYRFVPSSKGGSGRREVDEPQAMVVRRIFRDFVRGQSCHAITERLNEEAVETFQGWRPGINGPEATSWYPLTVRRILYNTYRDPGSSHKKRRIVTRPQEDWIEIPDATPAIVDRETWATAQRILMDPPMRGRRGQAQHPYPLSGHIRCSHCRTPLAGSALSGGKGRSSIRYYTCRNRFRPRHASACPSRYVRADQPEQVLIEKIGRVLACPEEILSAYRLVEATQSAAGQHEVKKAQRRLSDANAQIARLTRLARFTEDEGATEAIAVEFKAAASLKRAAEADLNEMQTSSQTPPLAGEISPAELARMSRQVKDWLDADNPEKMKLVLEGLDITILAGVGQPTAKGSLPVRATHRENRHAHVRPVVM